MKNPVAHESAIEAGMMAYRSGKPLFDKTIKELETVASEAKAELKEEAAGEQPTSKSKTPKSAQSRKKSPSKKSE